MLFKSKSKKPTAPQGVYREVGIWDPELRQNPEEIIKRYGINAPSSRKEEKPWGLRHVIYSGLAFLAVQLIVGIGVYGVAASSIPIAELSELSLAQKSLELLSNPLVLILVQSTMYLTWLGFMFFATRFRGAKNWAEDFGLKFKWTDPMFGALIAWGLILFQLALIWFLTTVFPSLNMSGSDNSGILTNQTGALGIITALLIGGVVGPIAEELYFRGFVMRGLIRFFTKQKLEVTAVTIGENVKKFMYRYRDSLGIVISSVFFGFMHFQGVDTFGQWFVVILTGSLGLLLAVIAHKTNRIGLVIFIHIFFNSTQIAIAFLQ